MSKVTIKTTSRTAKALSAVATFYEIEHAVTDASQRFAREVRRVATAVKAAQRRAAK